MHRRWRGNGAPTADAPNLQRRVYDVAAAATECHQTQAHCAREAVIKCNALRHHCVGRVLVLDRWAARRQGNSLSCHMFYDLCGIRMSAQVSFILSQSAFDRQNVCCITCTHGKNQYNTVNIYMIKHTAKEYRGGLLDKNLLTPVNLTSTCMQLQTSQCT